MAKWGTATVQDWLLVRAVAAKGFTKSPASMSVAGVVGFTASFYRDRTSDARHNMMNKNTNKESHKYRILTESYDRQIEEIP